MEKQESFLKTITEIAFCIFVAYTCVCMCLWVCMCRPEGVFSLSFPPCFLKQALSLSPELTNCLDGMARGLPGSWCLHVPVLGSQHMLPQLTFYECWGSELRSLHLNSNHSIHWAFPSPDNSSSGCLQVLLLKPAGVLLPGMHILKLQSNASNQKSWGLGQQPAFNQLLEDSSDDNIEDPSSKYKTGALGFCFLLFHWQGLSV